MQRTMSYKSGQEMSQSAHFTVRSPNIFIRRNATHRFSYCWHSGICQTVLLSEILGTLQKRGRGYSHTIWLASALATSTPEMTSQATSGRLEIDLISADLKCDYAILTQAICEMLTVLVGKHRPLPIDCDFDSLTMKIESKCETCLN